jgi:hypothetical protein
VRIEFPLRIPVTKTLIFAIPLFCVQQLEHTSIIFSLLFFGFVMMGNFAFNAAGGFSKASGAYVFLYAMLMAIVGVTWKAVLGEPADSNLKVPILMMAAYTVSMALLLLVILVNKKLTSGLQSFSVALGMGELNYTLAALGCFVSVVTLQVLNSTIGATPGGLLAIINQLNLLMPIAIILGTIGAMIDSGGRHSVNFVSGLAMGITLVQGMLNFSKQAMLTPLACWVVAACYFRFNLRVRHMIALAAAGVLTFTVVPLIAGGRNLVPPSGAGFEQRAQIVYGILSDLKAARSDEEQSAEAAAESPNTIAYFNSSQGFMERLTIIGPDDAFFNYTAKGNYIGYTPVIEDFENFIPHFILPNKPVPIGGNYYAHLIGGFLAPDDFTTGISFSPVAEAYQLDGWISLCLLLPVLWLMLLFTTDYICGDLRESPWGLLMVVVFAHSAAESLLGSMIYLTVYGSLGLILAILFSTRVAPIIGVLFYGRRQILPAAPGRVVPDTP